MGLETSQILLNVLHPKIRCQIVPATETQKHCWEGEELKHQEICHHMSNSWCVGGGHPCWARSFLCLLGADALHTPVHPYRQQKKDSGTKVVFAVPTVQYSMCLSSLLKPLIGMVENA